MNKNYVLEGIYKNAKISERMNYLSVYTEKYIGGRPLIKKQVSYYTVIDETNKEEYSFWKGALGVALLGSAGAIAGLRGKKTKEYLIAIEWKDGQKSLISLDDEYYKVFVRSMF